MCVRKKECSISKYEIFGIIMSFGCSAVETEKTSYNLMPISKAVFFVIFVPCLFFLSYTIAFMPNVGFEEITDATTLKTLNTTHCLNLCHRDESTKNNCGNLWRYLEDEMTIDVNQTSPFTKSNISLTFPQTDGVILIALSSLLILSAIEGLLESRSPYSPYQLLYQTTEDLSDSDKKIKMLMKKEAKLSKEIKTLTKNLASQKKSSKLKLKEVQTNLSKTSEQKIEKVQTDYMKNIILSVTLKNDVLKYESNFQGTYEISDMVNGKPSWIFHENQRAIWYHPEQEHWKIGALKNLGKPSSSLHSIVNGDFDPHNIPSNKWNYYNSKDKVWKVTDKDGVFIENGGKEAFIYFNNEKAAKHGLLKEKAFKSLTVALNNDVSKAQKLCEGQYELGDIVIGKPSWQSKENKRAIWYDGEKWRIGNAEDIGLEYIDGGISSFENEDPDPTCVPSDKWKHYKGYAWKEVGANGIVIESKGKNVCM